MLSSSQRQEKERVEALIKSAQEANITHDRYSTDYALTSPEMMFAANYEVARTLGITLQEAAVKYNVVTVKIPTPEDATRTKANFESAKQKLEKAKAGINANPAVQTAIRTFLQAEKSYKENATTQALVSEFEKAKKLRETDEVNGKKAYDKAKAVLDADPTAIAFQSAKVELAKNKVAKDAIAARDNFLSKENALKNIDLPIKKAQEDAYKKLIETGKPTFIYVNYQIAQGKNIGMHWSVVALTKSKDNSIAVTNINSSTVGILRSSNIEGFAAGTTAAMQRLHAGQGRVSYSDHSVDRQHNNCCGLSCALATAEVVKANGIPSFQRKFENEEAMEAGYSALAQRMYSVLHAKGNISQPVLNLEISELQRNALLTPDNIAALQGIKGNEARQYIDQVLELNAFRKQLDVLVEDKGFADRLWAQHASYDKVDMEGLKLRLDLIQHLNGKGMALKDAENLAAKLWETHPKGDLIGIKQEISRIKTSPIGNDKPAENRQQIDPLQAAYDKYKAAFNAQDKQKGFEALDDAVKTIKGNTLLDAFRQKSDVTDKDMRNKFIENVKKREQSPSQPTQPLAKSVLSNALLTPSVPVKKTESQLFDEMFADLDPLKGASKSTSVHKTSLADILAHGKQKPASRGDSNSPLTTTPSH